MTYRWVFAAVLAAALVLPITVRAHEGHPHKVMGTVSAVEGNHIMLKTTDGKTVTIVLNQKTTFTRGKQKVDASAVKAGERVVVEVASEKAMIATSVTLAAPAPVTAKK